MRPTTYPCDHNVERNDTIRLYAGLDGATTGVHTIQGYLLFSSHPAPYNLKAQKSAVIAGSTSANTEAGSATLSTIAGRTSALLGFWNYIIDATPTAAQTVGGYMKIASAVDGWQEQLIPTNIQASGLGTDIASDTMPLVCAIPELLARFSGLSRLDWLEPFPVTTKQDFVFSNYMDGTNTVAPLGRYGMIWRE